MIKEKELAAGMIEAIRREAGKIRGEVRIMEVCGTHTVALRRAGIHSLLPETIRLISGPGCPVCVTPGGYIDNSLALLQTEGVFLASFGDLLKVPGAGGATLGDNRSNGRVHLVYSPSELAARAAEEGELVFLGIGFETTMPAVASAFLRAAEAGTRGLFLYPAFKAIPPALKALLAAEERCFDALILPGHVSTILGVEAYRFLEGPQGVPGAVAGFEPLDLLAAILALLRQLASGRRRVENLYPRAVRSQGNPKARETAERVFEPCDALWRGLGVIPGSGFRLRPEFACFDAETRFGLPPIKDQDPPGCSCGLVLQGRIQPPECPLFGTECLPSRPVGPCMVSSEGSCAAYYTYQGADG